MYIFIIISINSYYILLFSHKSNAYLIKTQQRNK